MSGTPRGSPASGASTAWPQPPRSQVASPWLRPPMSSVSSQIASGSNGSNKRKTMGTSMGPPGGSPEKKVKRPTALETKLDHLKKTLNRFEPLWEAYDPGHFIKQMRHTCDRVGELTPGAIQQFVASRECEGLPTILDELDHQLLTPSTDSQLLERTRNIRKGMSAHVEDVRRCLRALVDQAQAKPAPCDFADSKIWRIYQEQPNPILCLRPARQSGWPIPLMHKAFCDFTRYFHEPCLDEDTADYLIMAGKLCQEMPSAFDSEVQRRDTFEHIFLSLDKGLTQHLEYPLSGQVSIAQVKESGARPDVAKTISYEGGTLVLMLEEFKNEVGDTYMQICRAYEVLCGDPKVERLVKFGNPVFLLCVVGPYLMVCGAVKRDNVHVEPLTPLLPMLPGCGIDGRPVQLAHCLRALKEGLGTLQKFWRDVGVTGDAGEGLLIDEPQRQDPHCPDNGLLRFGDWEGTFESPMHNVKDLHKAPCFLANLRNVKSGDDVQVVVKFVYNYSGTYGTATHDFLYDLKLAPRLYSAVNLHRGLVMVVMEHLAFREGIGGWVELDTFEKRLGDKADAVRKKLEEIIDHLQKCKMVHADLRPKNIMVAVDGQRGMTSELVLKVIDFDWAGTVGEVRYPPLLNSHIQWPSGAKGYAKVGDGDDLILLDNWWATFV